MAAKERTVSDGEVHSQVKTRVWGLSPKNENAVGALAPVTSTLAWGCPPFYDGTAVDRLDQRYYAVGTGRFNTPDPYQASAGAGDPGSWNRYSYVQGDPVNFIDPQGRFLCNPDYCNADTPLVGPDDNAAVPGRVIPPKPRGVQDKGGWNTDPNTTGQTAWQYLNSIWSNCLSDFKQIPGFSASQFGETLLNMSFVDARDKQTLATNVNFYTGSGDMRTLAQVLANGDNAVTLPGSNVVALSGNYFSDLTQTEQVGAAIHEALHMTFPSQSEVQLAGVLMNFGFQPSSKFTSGEITDWIVGSPNHAATTGGGCKNPGSKNP